MYKFSLKFDSDTEELGFTNGIPMNQLGELITSIYSVLEAKKGDKLILSDIKDNCYQVEAITSNPAIPDRFVGFSKGIYEKSNAELSTKELRYKNILARILKTSWYVDIIDNEENSVLRIPYGFNEKVVEHYYSYKSIDGIITEIGDKQLNPEDLHIYISNYPDFKVFINQEQHDSLKEYYRGLKIHVKLKLKKSLDSNRILSAQLVSFRTKSKANFPHNLDSLDFSNLKFLNE